MTREELRNRAITLQLETETCKRDPRYLKTIGSLVRTGLLVHNRVAPYRGLVTVEDALWAGDLEPRIFELLPAVLLKKPKLFTRTGPLPQDLAKVLNDLRRGTATQEFRGISAKNYSTWVKRVGRAGKNPSLLKTFRFAEEDLLKLDVLRKLTGDSETDIIRKGMDLLYSTMKR